MSPGPVPPQPFPPPHPWRWQPLPATALPPLPGAAVARGKGAHALLRHLQTWFPGPAGREEEAPAADAPTSDFATPNAPPLQVVAGTDLLVLLGADTDLPWVPGIAYAYPAYPGLWLPTAWTTDLPPELMFRALHARHPRAPLLLLREPTLLVPLDRPLPLSAALLTEVAARWGLPPPASATHTP